MPTRFIERSTSSVPYHNLLKRQICKKRLVEFKELVTIGFFRVQIFNFLLFLYFLLNFLPL